MELNDGIKNNGEVGDEVQFNELEEEDPYCRFEHMGVAKLSTASSLNKWRFLLADYEGLKCGEETEKRVDSTAHDDITRTSRTSRDIVMKVS